MKYLNQTGLSHLWGKIKALIPTTPSQVGAMPSSPVVTSFWTGTQAEYDAITTKSDTTLYLIKEG